MTDLVDLAAAVPENVPLGLHWCYGTWGGWPMTEMPNLELCVRLSNAAVARIKGHTQLPVCVGFGVRTAEQARAIAEGADGVVVGSALVDTVRANLGADGKATPATVASVAGLVRALAEGVRGVRRRVLAAN